jgi:MFS family permease
MGMTMTGFTVYQPYLISMGGLSNTQSSTLVTIRSVFALLSMLGVTWFYKKLKLRAGLTVAIAGVVVAFTLFGLAHSYLGYAVAIAIAGLSYGLGGMIAVSMLINQWFVKQRALALGICSAATGASTIVLSPVVTVVVHRWSLSTAFIGQAVFTALVAVGVAAVVRENTARARQTAVVIAEQDRPDEAGAIAAEADQFRDGNVIQIINAPKDQSAPKRNPVLNVIPVCVAMVLLGGLGNTAMAHISVLYTTVGRTPHQVSLLLSLIGLALVIGKLIYGKAVDRFGGYISNYVFFALVLIGNALCSIAGITGFGVAILAMIISGIGLPLATVGISIFAADLSRPADFTRVLQVFQVLYMVGSMVFGVVPGILADHTGSYVPFFVLCVILTVAVGALVQWNYLRMRPLKAMAY